MNREAGFDRPQDRRARGSRRFILTLSGGISFGVSGKNEVPVDRAGSASSSSELRFLLVGLGAVPIREGAMTGMAFSS